MMVRLRFSLAAFFCTVLSQSSCEAFVPRQPFRLSKNTKSATHAPRTSASSSSLRMAGVDLVTYLRTEWIAASLFTNQTPREADVCLQLGTEDGRGITFVPRTIREFVTSTTEKDGILPVAVRRQLKQQADRRQAASVRYVDQAADDLRETQDDSVDVVISLLCADRLRENGMDWKRSIREAARVLKPGGRFLFVEPPELDDESYVDYVANLMSLTEEDDEEDEDDSAIPLFEVLGWDPIELCVTPHMAGVALKSMDAGMTPQELAAREAQEEEERLAELSLTAFERGIKKRKRKKKKQTESETADAS